jgi:inhibitor of the pro-sigma K processing machinery
MKTFWLAMFGLSSILLAGTILNTRLPKGWLTRFGIHLVLSSMAIYALNYSGWLTGIYIPLNPASIGVVALLGLPGIALIAGLQQVLLT